MPKAHKYWTKKPKASHWGPSQKHPTVVINNPTNAFFAVIDDYSSSSDPIFSRSSSSSSFDSDLLFLLFFSFSPFPSSNLLLWNSSLSNSSSTWLNCSTTVVELEFESLDFWNWSRVLKTRDVSSQNPFKHALTYHILSPYCAILQIPSKNSP